MASGNVLTALAVLFTTTITINCQEMSTQSATISARIDVTTEPVMSALEDSENTTGNLPFTTEDTVVMERNSSSDHDGQNLSVFDSDNNDDSRHNSTIIMFCDDAGNTSATQPGNVSASIDKSAVHVTWSEPNCAGGFTYYSIEVETLPERTQTAEYQVICSSSQCQQVLSSDAFPTSQYYEIRVRGFTNKTKTHGKPGVYTIEIHTEMLQYYQEDNSTATGIDVTTPPTTELNHSISASQLVNNTNAENEHTDNSTNNESMNIERTHANLNATDDNHKQLLTTTQPTLLADQNNDKSEPDVKLVDCKEAGDSEITSPTNLTLTVESEKVRVKWNSPLCYKKFPEYVVTVFDGIDGELRDDKMVFHQVVVCSTDCQFMLPPEALPDCKNYTIYVVGRWPNSTNFGNAANALVVNHDFCLKGVVNETDIAEKIPTATENKAMTDAILPGNEQISSTERAAIEDKSERALDVPDEQGARFSDTVSPAGDNNGTVSDDADIGDSQVNTTESTNKTQHENATNAETMETDDIATTDTHQPTPSITQPAKSSNTTIHSGANKPETVDEAEPKAHKQNIPAATPLCVEVTDTDKTKVRDLQTVDNVHTVTLTWKRPDCSGDFNMYYVHVASVSGDNATTSLYRGESSCGQLECVHEINTTICPACFQQPAQYEFAVKAKMKSMPNSSPVVLRTHVDVEGCGELEIDNHSIRSCTGGSKTLTLPNNTRITFWRKNTHCRISCQKGYGFYLPVPELFICESGSVWGPQPQAPLCRPTTHLESATLQYTLIYHQSSLNHLQNTNEQLAGLVSKFAPLLCPHSIDNCTLTNVYTEPVLYAPQQIDFMKPSTSINNYTSYTEVTITVEPQVLNITDQTAHKQRIDQKLETFNKNNEFMTLLNYERRQFINPIVQQSPPVKAKSALCCQKCPKGFTYRAASCVQCPDPAQC